MKLLYKPHAFSGSVSAPCSSLSQLTGRRDGVALGMHPKSMPVQRGDPPLPEGSSVTAPAWRDLRKKPCLSRLEL